LPVDIRNDNINIVPTSFRNAMWPHRDVRYYLLFLLLLMSAEIAVIDGDTFFPPTFESINYCYKYTEEAEQRTFITACAIIKPECILRGPNDTRDYNIIKKRYTELSGNVLKSHYGWYNNMVTRVAWQW